MRCLATIFLPVLLALLASCQRETDVQRANREKILLIGNVSDPKSLDLQLVSGMIEAKIISALFEGLVTDHPSSDTIMSPGAATSWESNPDCTVWTFHLRPGAKWSDGVSVSAHDFVFAYHRMLSPEFAAPYVEMLYFIRNAEKFNKGKIHDFSQVGVKAIDDETLRVELREPVPYLPSITRHYTWYPIPRHVVLRYGQMTDRFTPWSEPGNIQGNGAFVLREWKWNDHIEVTKNPRYWNAEHVALNGIRFIPVENAYTEVRAFLAGQLHSTNKIPPALVDRIEREHPEYLRQEPFIGNYFIRVNTQRPGLADPRVRKALSMTVDRAELSRSLLKGYQPATTFTPRLGDYQPPAVLDFDPAKARVLLAGAGYPDGKGFPRYEILVSTASTRTACEALQAMWLKNLNIRFDFRAMDTGSYISAMQNLNYDIAFTGWVGDYLDPSTFLLMWTDGNGNNNTGWHSAAYKSLLREAAHKAENKDRFATYLRAESILMDEMPVIPIIFQARIYLHRPEVKGWYPLLLDNHPWTAVRIEP